MISLFSRSPDWLAESTAARGADQVACVSLHPLHTPSEVREAEQVVRLIEKTLDNYPPDMSDPEKANKSIGVLVRAKAHAALIAEGLRERGIRFSGTGLENSIDTQVVQDLLCLTRALTHQGDRTAWLGLLRGPWCGLTLADLESLAGGRKESIWELLSDTAACDRISVDGRKRVQRLMREMGIRALYPRRRTSMPGKGHKIYPYLLKGMAITRANQVWASDICYIPMARGFMYLVAIMDWHSRRVLSWRVSNTLDTGFCIEALEEALRRFGTPAIVNTDQGSQFTSEAFTGVLKDHGIEISMDGKGRWVDNVFVERLWRSVKYEDVYLRAYETPTELRAGLARYFTFYNTRRRHSALDRRTPDAVYFDQADRELAA